MSTASEATSGSVPSADPPSPDAVKVLLVAPVPTHPSTTGASARVRHMAEGLLSLGHEVHFLHLQQSLREPGTGMRQYWGDRLHVYRGLSPAGCLSRARRKVLRLTAKTFHLNLPVDSYFDPGCDRYVRELLARCPFDVVIVSYVFYSKLLESVPDPALKLIDTLDVFSDRYRLYREHGQSREFFSTSKEEEGKALDRADAVLAIQEWDGNHFRSLRPTPVAVVGHLAPPAGPPDGGASTSAPVMLFVGGPMGINVHGIVWFIDSVLPMVRSQVPEAELWLAGGISDRVRRAAPGVRRLGYVDALEDVYRQSAVVVNPQQFGTGISIKSIDALRHGRPLVTTASGARGLEEGAGTAFLQAGSAEEFGRYLIDLLRDPMMRAAQAQRAATFARRYHQRSLQALADVVNGVSA
ncbi:MAG TPA: glycosyltransferase family 4 protein [Gemmatimonadales bacterium]|nr:glycosyltransferase family 4 protein [Gemmatimonadales bacterium]